MNGPGDMSGLWQIEKVWTGVQNTKSWSTTSIQIWGLVISGNPQYEAARCLLFRMPRWVGCAIQTKEAVPF